MPLALDRFPEEADFHFVEDWDKYLLHMPLSMARMDTAEQMAYTPFGTNWAVKWNGVITPISRGFRNEEFLALNQELVAISELENSPEAAPRLSTAIKTYNDAESRLIEDQRQNAIRLNALPVDEFPVITSFDKIVDLDDAEDAQAEFAALEKDATTMPYKKHAAQLNGVLTPWNWLFSKERFEQLNQSLVQARTLIDAKDPAGPLKLVEAITVYNKAAIEPKPHPSGLLAGSAREIRFEFLDQSRAAYWERQLELSF